MPVEQPVINALRFALVPRWSLRSSAALRFSLMRRRYSWLSARAASIVRRLTTGSAARPMTAATPALTKNGARKPKPLASAPPTGRTDRHRAPAQEAVDAVHPTEERVGMID